MRSMTHPACPIHDTEGSPVVMTRKSTHRSASLIALLALLASLSVVAFRACTIGQLGHRVDVSSMYEDDFGVFWTPVSLSV